MSDDPLIKAITPPTEWYVVLRPFDGDYRFARGEVVNTTGWTHLESLVDLRYLAPLPHGAMLPDPDADGRRIIDLSEDQAKVVPTRKRPTPVRKVKENA